jgi:Sulfotransferase family
MMMHALAHGGLEPAHTAAWNDVAANPNGYIQNPNGFYELSIDDQMHPWFPIRHWGKLIKVHHVPLVSLAPGDYRVLFMMRDPREIKMSYRTLGEPTTPLRLGWKTDDDYVALMKRFMAAAAMRADMAVLEVWYSDVVADPPAAFERIRQFGFPIDPAAAARTIDPALHRHRAG